MNKTQFMEAFSGMLNDFKTKVQENLEQLDSSVDLQKLLAAVQEHVGDTIDDHYFDVGGIDNARFSIEYGNTIQLDEADYDFDTLKREVRGSLRDAWSDLVEEAKVEETAE